MESRKEKRNKNNIKHPLLRPFYNLASRVKNIPRRVRYSLKKNKKSPFHPTMLQQEIINKKESFGNRIAFGEGESEKRKQINALCDELEAKDVLTANDKIYMKEYCLSAENANVGVVNLNALNMNNESVNLPLVENPIQVANDLLDQATSLLDSLNQEMTRLPISIKPIAERVKRIKALQPELLAKVARGKELALQAKAKAQTVPTMPNASRFEQATNELLTTFDSIANELASMTVYSIQNARQNLRSGIRALGSNENRNLSNAYRTLRGSSSWTDLSLLGEYANALEKYQRRTQRNNRNRKVRVARMMGKRYGYGGRRTRKY